MSAIFRRIAQKTAEKPQPDARANPDKMPETTPTHFRPRRSFLVWILFAALAWELIARPLLAALCPDIVLPAPALREISIMLQWLLGPGL